MTPSEDLLADLRRRGVLHQVTDEASLKDHLQRPATIYCGFDATADSLHVGHLATLTLLRRLHAAGHRVIVLLGTATAQVGDPSFRTRGRAPLSSTEIADNAASIRGIVEKVLSGCDPLIISNGPWLNEIGLMDFLLTAGRSFTIGRMLSFEAVKTKINSGQSMTVSEFIYTLLQAIDFCELFRLHRCTIQVGGSDQWANIVNGIDLGRSLHGATLHGLTTALLTKANGEKMGKSTDGAVWLDGTKTPPFSMWQFWRNIDDQDVEPLLLRLTDLDIEEVQSMMVDINGAKICLANWMTALVHGADAAKAAERTATLPLQQAEDLAQLEASMAFDHSDALDHMLVSLGFSSSLTEARRLIDQRAVRLDGTSIQRQTRFAQGRHVLAVGKRRKAIIEIR